MDDSLISFAREYCYLNYPNLIVPYNLITIDIQINDIKLKAMIDTGCSKSVISEEVIKKCKLEDHVDLLTVNNVNTGNGTTETLGRIWILEFLINDYTVQISPSILKGEHEFDIILGIDFLSSNKIDINFSKRELCLSENCKILFEV